EQQLVFGRRAFFGYVVHRGAAYWFSNVARRDDPTAGDRSAVDPSTWLPHIRELHAEDPEPVPAILTAATDVAGVWPVYDVAGLPTWRRGRIGLLGDAAHATSPNAGQGASLALEDAVVLAACLRDVPVPAAARAPRRVPRAGAGAPRRRHRRRRGVAGLRRRRAADLAPGPHRPAG